MQLFGQSAQFLIGFKSNDLATVGGKPHRPEPVATANVEYAVTPPNIEHRQQMLVLTTSIQTKDTAYGAAEARKATGFVMSGHASVGTLSAM
jgi:hypothetical protein